MITVVHSGYFAEILYLLLKAFLGGVLGGLGRATFYLTEKVHIP